MISQLTKRSARKATVASALIAVGTALTGTAQAQWVVTDPALQTNVTANQLTQDAHLVQQYTQMITQYTSMLTTLRSLNLNIMPINNQLTPISDPSAMVSQACPGASLAGSALGAIGLDSSLVDGEIVSQQRAICTNIVLLQVDKYNTVANMLNQMNNYFAGLQQLTATADKVADMVSNAIGNREMLSNQTQDTQLRLSTEMANAQQHIQAVDATIATLKDQQSILANIALKGSNSTGLGALTGQIIQAGAFAAAFPQ